MSLLQKAPTMGVSHSQHADFLFTRTPFMHSKVSFSKASQQYELLWFSFCRTVCAGLIAVLSDSQMDHRELSLNASRVSPGFQPWAGSCLAPSHVLGSAHALRWEAAMSCEISHGLSHLVFVPGWISSLTILLPSTAPYRCSPL